MFPLAPPGLYQHNLHRQTYKGLCTMKGGLCNFTTTHTHTQAGRARYQFKAHWAYPINSAVT